MKLILILSLLFMSQMSMEDIAKFPDASLKDMNNKNVQLSELFAQKEKTIVSFWASWCSPCKRELDAILDLWDDWEDEFDVQLVAISIDDVRGMAKVPGIVASREWPYTILKDSNQELMRALSFQTIPQSFVVDQSGEILYSHNGYTPGDEYELEDILKQ